MLKNRLLELEASIKRTQDTLDTIVVTSGVDTGVILLDYEGTTHYDEDSKCAVFDNMYFSPLGDALIEIRDHLIELRQQIKGIIES